MKILTPAKINPLLYILRKRKDGFHELYMHVVPVSFFDVLKFSKNKFKSLNFEVKGADFFGEPEDNLVLKAIRIFEKFTGKKVYLDIFLKKNIPSGAGLGGGSGNAAGTLKVLNHIFRESPKEKYLLHPIKLFEIALELGSDVPFFLNPSPCEISGRGEKINPLHDYPKLFVIIIKPHFSISSLEAYINCIPKEQKISPSVKSIDNLKNYMNNQFEASLFPQFPVLSEMKSLLLQYGAFGALVSGSGSAVFGVFREKKMQNQALEKLSCLQIGEIFSCETLVSHHYF